MRVQGYENIWAIGDIAAVPDPARPGEPCPPTAQHAIRQGKLLGKNIAAVMRGQAPKPFTFKTLGAFADLGRHTRRREPDGGARQGLPRLGDLPLLPPRLAAGPRPQVAADRGLVGGDPVPARPRGDGAARSSAAARDAARPGTPDGRRSGRGILDEECAATTRLRTWPIAASRILSRRPMSHSRLRGIILDVRCDLKAVRPRARCTRSRSLLPGGQLLDIVAPRPKLRDGTSPEFSLLAQHAGTRTRSGASRDWQVRGRCRSRAVGV